MIKDYVVWMPKREPNSCYLEKIMAGDGDFEKRTNLRYGVSRINNFPDNACFHMAAKHPHNTLLYDRIRNIALFIVVSKELQQLLSEENLIDVEYLPVTIFDHKGRVASSEYYIVHPINPVPCLDLDKCNPDWSPLNKSVIFSVEKIVVDDSKVDTSRKLFKFNHFYEPVMIHRELAKKIEEKGFTGNEFCELRDFRR